MCVWKWDCCVCNVHSHFGATYQCIAISSHLEAILLRLRVPCSSQIHQLKKTCLTNSWEYTQRKEVFEEEAWFGSWLDIFMWPSLIIQASGFFGCICSPRDRYLWNNLSILTTNGWDKGNYIYSTHPANTGHYLNVKRPYCTHFYQTALKLIWFIPLMMTGLLSVFDIFINVICILLGSNQQESSVAKTTA